MDSCQIIAEQKTQIAKLKEENERIKNQLQISQQNIIEKEKIIDRNQSIHFGQTNAQL